MSSKPDAAALEISADEARDLAHVIKSKWAAWAGDPLEADSAGRHTFHEIAAAAFMSWLTTGEMLVAFDGAGLRCRGRRPGRRVAVAEHD